LIEPADQTCIGRIGQRAELPQVFGEPGAVRREKA
jgi:hypothetical protein